MINVSQQRLLIGLLAALFLGFPGTTMVLAQQPDPASVIQQVDAAVKARIDNIAEYTVTEHYAVYRNKDEVHPVAEMTVKTIYQKESGKSYVILSQSGSEIVRNLILSAILDNEKRINLPGIREGAWITSANYRFKLKPGGPALLNGQDCLVLAMIPKRKEPYLIEGLLWVDAKDGSIVQVVGTTSKSSSLLTGATQVTRQYANVSGYPQATHVRAVSDSYLFGQTVVKIDYHDYHVELSPPV